MGLGGRHALLSMVLAWRVPHGCGGSRCLRRLSSCPWFWYLSSCSWFREMVRGELEDRTGRMPVGLGKRSWFYLKVKEQEGSPVLSDRWQISAATLLLAVRVLCPRLGRAFADCSYRRAVVSPKGDLPKAVLETKGPWRWLSHLPRSQGLHTRQDGWAGPSRKYRSSSQLCCPTKSTDNKHACDSGLENVKSGLGT